MDKFKLILTGVISAIAGGLMVFNLIYALLHCDFTNPTHLIGLGIIVFAVACGTIVIYFGLKALFGKDI